MSGDEFTHSEEKEYIEHKRTNIMPYLTICDYLGVCERDFDLSGDKLCFFCCHRNMRQNIPKILNKAIGE